MKTPTILAAAALLGTAPKAPGLHVFTSGEAGFATHSIWYDDGHEVTVVDTQFTPQIAEELIAAIKRATSSPITRVIVTHPNPDKFNALSAFHALGAESITSAKTAAAMPGVDAYKRYYWTKIAKAFTEETYPKLEAVKHTFTGQEVIKLESGETLTLFELAKPGVSNNQVVVRIDKTGDLVVGDLVAYQNHAWLEGGIVDGKAQPTLGGWKDDLRALPALGHGIVYGGRGAAGPVDTVVKDEIAYLDKVDAIVSAYVQRLGSKARFELTDPTASAVHFAAMQAAIADAFPSYAMPGLIGYSVYGLAQSKLR